ncbi:Copper radical oxidase [Mycena kentingensis (nom. inval.)]|nr:Copper radical oxidase [Mycena kentingensis (nom. inval.)]
MKLLITGATGFVGGEVLSQSIRNPAISSVVVLTRRPLPKIVANEPKVKEIVMQDFNVYSEEVKKELEGADACVWALGARLAVPEVEIDYPLALARAIYLLQRDVRRTRPNKNALDDSRNSGVSAMQLAVISESKAIIYDKVENNPLKINGNLAWIAELDLNTHTVRALESLTNSWCATGSFLSNGTFVNSGGTPITIPGPGASLNGLQSIRMFTPCTDESCELLEEPTRIRTASARWYASSVRIEDGSILIFGGSVQLAFINGPEINNPTYEFFPPKNIHGFNGLPIPSQFLVDTLNGNHFPNVVYLPDGTIYVSANQQAMIFDWKTNTERRLPPIPNGVRISSPFSASHVLLPLSAANRYTPEILICGGSTLDENTNPFNMSSQAPTSAQCIRMVLNEEGIAAGWKVESMPEGRFMLDMLLLPDGRVLIVNGAKTGVAGYGSVFDQIGQSNADNPALQPIVYDPEAPEGARFSSEGIAPMTIPRMYHSSASLTPSGQVLLAGSNPNSDFSTIEYQTEYRLDWYSPPYMHVARPSYTGLPGTIDYKSVFSLAVHLPAGTNSVTVALMDLGFATHGVHMDQRLVYLDAVLSRDKKTLKITAPPTAPVFPPGPAFLFVVTDTGVPSVARKTLVGTGASPPVDQAALSNMLNKTTVDLNATVPTTTASSTATRQLPTYAF